MTTTARADADAFQALLQDWSAVCRQGDRSAVLTEWAAREVALAGIQSMADVVPPAGVDRGPLCAAMARLYVRGDDLAGRTLLQLLVPGMCRLTAAWCRRLPGGVNGAAWEVITRSYLYIAHLRERSIRCSPAGYVLRSVARDLVIEADNEARSAPARALPVDDRDDLCPPLPSAEETASSGELVWSALRDGVQQGVIPPESVRVVWLALNGYTAGEAAEATFNSVASVYRLRRRVRGFLAERLGTEGAA